MTRPTPETAEIRGKLRVAVVMLTLVRNRMGGTEVYARNLLRGIADAADPRFEFTAVYSDDGAGFGELTLLEAPAAHVRELTLREAHSGTSHIRKGWLWLRTTLGRSRIWREVEAAAGGPIDVALFPFSAVEPKPLARTHSVTIIHDLQHIDRPESFTLTQRWFRRLTYERPAKRADAVITVSDFTKGTIEKYLGIPPARVHRIYPGISPDFFEPTPRNARSQRSAFLFYPARGLPHKNHERLFEAFELVRVDYPQLRLVLSGADADALGALPEHVEHVGNVSVEQIRDLYRDCAAVVFPSLYEGFGFPALEAVASGAPLVVSRAGSLPEIVASYATLVDPNDVADIARGIRSALDQGANKAAAQEHARQFTWQSTVTETLDVLWSVGSQQG